MDFSEGKMDIVTAFSESSGGIFFEAAKLIASKKKNDPKWKSSNSEELKAIYSKALSLLETIPELPWQNLVDCQYDEIMRVYQSWVSFAFRYGFEPPDQQIPSPNSEQFSERKRRRPVKRGIAVRDSHHKTAKVEVTRRKKHEKYKKIEQKRKSYLVHDEFNQIKEGDMVIFTETRPLSKRKNHKVVGFSQVFKP